MQASSELTSVIPVPESTMQHQRSGFRFPLGAFVLAILMVFGANVGQAAADQSEHLSVVPPDLMQFAQASAPRGDGKALPERDPTVPAAAVEPATTGGPRPASEAPTASERPARSAGPAANWWSWTGQAPPRHSPLQTLTPQVEANAASTPPGERQRIPGPCCRSVPVTVPDSTLSLI